MHDDKFKVSEDDLGDLSIRQGDIGQEIEEEDDDSFAPDPDVDSNTGGGEEESPYAEIEEIMNPYEEENY